MLFEVSNLLMMLATRWRSHGV